MAATTMLNSSIDTSEQFVSLLKKPTNRQVTTKQQQDNGQQLTRRQSSTSNGTARKHRSITYNKQNKKSMMAPATTTTAITSMDGNLKITKQQRSVTTHTTSQSKNQSKEAHKQQRKSQKPRRRVATMAQRRAANIRERRRMFNLNSAFDKLRKKVPSFAYEKRLSRIETLKLAIMYIKFMDDLVHDDDYVEKYKQLTANNGVGGGLAMSASSAPSGFLSSGALLSLYGTTTSTTNHHLHSTTTIQMAGVDQEQQHQQFGLNQQPQKQSSSPSSNVASCCPPSSTSPPHSTTSAATKPCQSSSSSSSSSSSVSSLISSTNNFGTTLSDCSSVSTSPLSTSICSSTTGCSNVPRHQATNTNLVNYSGNHYYANKAHRYSQPHEPIYHQHSAQQQDHYATRAVAPAQIESFIAKRSPPPSGLGDEVTYYNLQPKLMNKSDYQEKYNHYHQQQQHYVSNQQSHLSSPKDQSILASADARQQQQTITRTNYSPNPFLQATDPFSQTAHNSNNHYEPFSQQQSHHHLSSLANAHHPPGIGYHQPTTINSQLQAR